MPHRGCFLVFYLVGYSVAPATGQLGSSGHPYSYVVPYGARRVQQQFFRNDLISVVPDFLFLDSFSFLLTLS